MGWGRLCPRPLRPWLGAPLPFSAMGIRGCRKHQVPQPTPHSLQRLPTSRSTFKFWLILEWFSSGVSQSCQSPPQALSALTLRSQSTVTEEGEESTHLCSPHKGSCYSCNQPQNVPEGVLWLQGWDREVVNLSLWGEIKLVGEKFMYGLCNLTGTGGGVRNPSTESSLPGRFFALTFPCSQINRAGPLRELFHLLPDRVFTF